MNPRYIFPDAKTCIVLAFRIPRGYFRGIEEGTYFCNYTAMGYAGINEVYGPIVLREICRYLEDFGYEAVPVSNISFPTNRTQRRKSAVTLESIFPMCFSSGGLKQAADSL